MPCEWILGFKGCGFELTVGSSSGLLLYASLVDLLAEDFLSEEANRTLTKKDKMLAFGCVILGGEKFLLFDP